MQCRLRELLGTVWPEIYALNHVSVVLLPVNGSVLPLEAPGPTCIHYSTERCVFVRGLEFRTPIQPLA